MEDPRLHPVLVVDFGAQYAQLIARRIRELHVYSVIVDSSITAREVLELVPSAIVLSGGPASVWVDGSPALDPEILRLGIPILGICYGAQLLAQQLGGKVVRNGSGEYGRTRFIPSVEGGLLSQIPSVEFDVWMSHQDAIVEAPAGATVIGSTEGAPVAAFEDRERKIYGVQFHPEVSHSQFGQEVFSAFLFDQAGTEPRWTNFTIIEDAIAQIRDQVGQGRAICALSGGVDSTVAAVLAHEALGDRLTCVFVDTGLMREGEADEVVSLFEAHFRIRLVRVDASERFLSVLAGVTDPEEKRKLIGETFIRVFEEQASVFDDVKFLVQGTLYPDVIESGTASAAKIKSHHNVGGLPENMDFELIEPLKWLFKDEVRRVGIELGIPESFIWRQPFPGPGLAVRILGPVDPGSLEKVRKADAIVQEELRKAGLLRSLWQAFAVLAPSLRSVGVSGDGRTYDSPIIIRAVDSEDAMTADWARLPYDVLDRMARRIVNEVSGINRVVYDVTGKPPGTIEWE
jgi:GMP synthase (glutamine-hydrolysing)